MEFPTLVLDAVRVAKPAWACEAGTDAVRTLTSWPATESSIETDGKLGLVPPKGALALLSELNVDDAFSVGLHLQLASSPNSIPFRTVAAAHVLLVLLVLSFQG